MIKYVFFDLDGTVTDSGLGITNSVAYSLGKYGISVENRAELNTFVGPPLVDSYMKYCGFSREKALKAVEVYREYYSDKGIFEFTVYDGVMEMLKSLKLAGKRLFLATSKPEIFAERILKKAGLDIYFDGVFGATMDSARVEKTDIISYALSRLTEIDVESSVMIGDRCFDVLGAKATGMRSVGVTYGYGSEEELAEAGADFIVKAAADIPKILISLR